MTVPQAQPDPFTEAWLPGHDGIKFYTRTYAAPSPKAVAIFTHGFSEHIGRYQWAHSQCPPKGITLFAYDQRGYGRTALDSAHKSRGSAFGKTSLHDGLVDLEWWLKYLRQQYPTLPIFAIGNSMGGALLLAFVTRTNPPPSKDAVSLLSGIVSSGTLLLQMVAKSKSARYLGGKLSAVLPYLVIPATLPDDYLTRNPEVKAAIKTDRYSIQKGSLKGLSDMLDLGERMFYSEYQRWPRELPVLFLHGSADKITCFKSAQEFIEKIDAEDKTFKPFPGAYHELFHEPDGVKEAFMEECTSWILSHAEAYRQQKQAQEQERQSTGSPEGRDIGARL